MCWHKQKIWWRISLEILSMKFRFHICFIEMLLKKWMVSGSIMHVNVKRLEIYLTGIYLTGNAIFNLLSDRHFLWCLDNQLDTPETVYIILFYIHAPIIRSWNAWCSIRFILIGMFLFSLFFSTFMPSYKVMKCV